MNKRVCLNFMKGSVENFIKDSTLSLIVCEIL